MDLAKDDEMRRSSVETVAEAVLQPVERVENRNATDVLNQRRRDRLAVFPHRVHHIPGESILDAEAAHDLHVPGTSPPEPVVVAQHQVVLPRRQAGV